MRTRSLLALLLATLAPSSAALGAGFASARFGGEQGHPTTDDPTAMYYNPAGLALRGGTRLYLNGVFAFRFAAYDRPREGIDNLVLKGMSGTGTPEEAASANSGRATLTNFIASPFIGLTTDFGVKNLGVGLSFYAPFGGQSTWDSNEQYRGNASYPGAVDGVQRWATIDGQIRVFYVTAAGSYYIPAARLSLGLGVNFIYQDITTLRARNSNGGDDLVTSAGTVQEGRSLLDAKGMTASISVGAIVQPVVDKLWIGLSYQSQPGFGENTLTGTLRNKLGAAPEEKQNIEIKQALPDFVRLGFRYRPIRRLELRLFGEYARWSVLQRQCVLDADDKARACKIKKDGALDTGGSGVILSLERRWQDTFGVRAGISHWVHDDVELFLGGGYDGNAIPESTLEPSLMDMDKITASVGGRFEFVRKKLALAITYTQVFYFDRTIAVRAKDADGKPIPQFVAPSRSPDMAGKYSQSIGLASVALEYKF